MLRHLVAIPRGPLYLCQLIQKLDHVVDPVFQELLAGLLGGLRRVAEVSLLGQLFRVPVAREVHARARLIQFLSSGHSSIEVARKSLSR